MRGSGSTASSDSPGPATEALVTVALLGRRASLQLLQQQNEQRARQRYQDPPGDGSALGSGSSKSNKSNKSSKGNPGSANYHDSDKSCQSQKDDSEGASRMRRPLQVEGRQTSSSSSILSTTSTYKSQSEMSQYQQQQYHNPQQQQHTRRRKRDIFKRALGKNGGWFGWSSSSLPSSGGLSTPHQHQQQQYHQMHGGESMTNGSERSLASGASSAPSTLNDVSRARPAGSLSDPSDTTDEDCSVKGSHAYETKHATHANNSAASASTTSSAATVSTMTAPGAMNSDGSSLNSGPSPPSNCGSLASASMTCRRSSVGSSFGDAADLRVQQNDSFYINNTSTGGTSSLLAQRLASDEDFELIVDPIPPSNRSSLVGLSQTWRNMKADRKDGEPGMQILYGSLPFLIKFVIGSRGYGFWDAFLNTYWQYTTPSEVLGLLQIFILGNDPCDEDFTGRSLHLMHPSDDGIMVIISRKEKDVAVLPQEQLRKTETTKSNVASKVTTENNDDNTINNNNNINCVDAHEGHGDHDEEMKLHEDPSTSDPDASPSSPIPPLIEVTSSTASENLLHEIGNSAKDVSTIALQTCPDAPNPSLKSSSQLSADSSNTSKILRPKTQVEDENNNGSYLQTDNNQSHQHAKTPVKTAALSISQESESKNKESESLRRIFKELGLDADKATLQRNAHAFLCAWMRQEGNNEILSENEAQSATELMAAMDEWGGPNDEHNQPVAATATEDMILHHDERRKLSEHSGLALSTPAAPPSINSNCTIRKSLSETVSCTSEATRFIARTASSSISGDESLSLPQASHVDCHNQQQQGQSNTECEDPIQGATSSFAGLRVETNVAPYRAPSLSSATASPEQSPRIPIASPPLTPQSSGSPLFRASATPNSLHMSSTGRTSSSASILYMSTPLPPPAAPPSAPPSSASSSSSSHRKSHKKSFALDFVGGNHSGRSPTFKINARARSLSHGWKKRRNGESVSSEEGLSMNSPAASRGHGGDAELEGYSPSAVAQFLTWQLYDEAYRLVEPRDLVTKDARDKSIAVQRLIELFDTYAWWALTYILNRHIVVVERVNRLLFFVDVATECRKLNNFHAFFGLVAGLSQPMLQWLWDFLSSKEKQHLENLKRAVRSKGDYLVYRADLSKAAHKSHIPFLGLTTKLLYPLEHNIPYVSVDQPRMINFSRCVSLQNTIDDFLRGQQFGFEVDGMFPICTVDGVHANVGRATAASSAGSWNDLASSEEGSVSGLTTMATVFTAYTNGISSNSNNNRSFYSTGNGTRTTATSDAGSTESREPRGSVLIPKTRGSSLGTSSVLSPTTCVRLNYDEALACTIRIGMRRARSKDRLEKISAKLKHRLCEDLVVTLEHSGFM
mmetsp:Transcript_3099/g.5277  ORF Transcript_3099/g.5277 Transcript_3099/m.5277 type:complete len:1366 (+) Transcript_3099:3-4100(+)